MEMKADKPSLGLLVCLALLATRLITSVSSAATAAGDLGSPAPAAQDQQIRLASSSQEKAAQDPLPQPQYPVMSAPGLDNRESRHIKTEVNENNLGLRHVLFPFFPQGTGRGSWKPIKLGANEEGIKAQRSTVSLSWTMAPSQSLTLVAALSALVVGLL